MTPINQISTGQYFLHKDKVHKVVGFEPRVKPSSVLLQRSLGVKGGVEMLGRGYCSVKAKELGGIEITPESLGWFGFTTPLETGFRGHLHSYFLIGALDVKVRIRKDRDPDFWFWENSRYPASVSFTCSHIHQLQALLAIYNSTLTYQPCTA